MSSAEKEQEALSGDVVLGGEREVVRGTPRRGALDRYPAPVANDREGWTLAEDTAFFYDVDTSNGGQYLLVVTPKDATDVWLWGWRYPRDLRVVQDAMAEWDPHVHDEPRGFIKRAGGLIRRAPARDKDLDRNRERCEHGRYLTALDCPVIACAAWQPGNPVRPQLAQEEPQMTYGQGLHREPVPAPASPLDATERAYLVTRVEKRAGVWSPADTTVVLTIGTLEELADSEDGASWEAGHTLAVWWCYRPADAEQHHAALADLVRRANEGQAPDAVYEIREGRQLERVSGMVPYSVDVQGRTGDHLPSTNSMER